MKKLTTLLVIISIFFTACITQSYAAVPRVIKNYKFTIGLGTACHTALAYQAFQIYKTEALKKAKSNGLKNKQPWSYVDFIKKYPNIYLNALFAENRKKTKPDQAELNNYTKIVTATMGAIFGAELLFNNRKGRPNRHPRPLRPPQPAPAPWNNWNMPVQPAPMPPAENRIIDYHQAAVEESILPADTDAQLIAQRKKEERNLTPGTILLEQSHSCLFCYEKFEDQEEAYFYGCNPSHLYHKKCIPKWEAHDNNGYYHGETKLNRDGTPRPYPNPHGCHMDCDAGNLGDKNIRPQLTKITVKLRAAQKPGHHEYAPVIDGLITDPCDDSGNILRVCYECGEHFKNGEAVAFANHHAACNTNHIVHEQCMTTFRTMCDGGNTKRGNCWIHRGIACPYRCTDPECPPNHGRNIDPEPVHATVHFTDGNPKPELPIETIIKLKKTDPTPYNFRTYNCTNCNEVTHSTTYSNYPSCPLCNDQSNQYFPYTNFEDLDCCACNKKLTETKKDCLWINCEKCKRDYQYCKDCFTAETGCAMCGTAFSTEEIEAAKIYKVPNRYYNYYED